MFRGATLSLSLSLLACGGPRITYVEPPPKVELQLEPGVATVTWELGLNATSTLLVRTLGSVDAPAPDAGRVGDSLGAGVILSVGAETKWIDANLPSTCGPFAWHLWSHAEDGTWAKTAATVRSLRGAHTLAPTAEVTNLSAVFESNLVRLRWTAPDSSTAFEGVSVRRKVGSPPLTLDEGTIVYAGPSTMATDALANLSATQDTWYAVFNCNACGKCGATAPSIAVMSPGDGGVSLSIAALSAQLSTDGQQVELGWTSTAPRVRVLRSLNGSPTGPDDTSATVVFDGAGAAASHRVDALLPHLPLQARGYTYSAWGCLGTTCSTTPSSTTLSLTLRQALRGGGYNLFFRHATAVTCVDNTALGTASTTTTPNWWKSCEASCATATARQLTPLSADGELAAVRTFFQGSGATVSRVLSSEFCRAVRTAEGFQLGPVVEQLAALTYFVYDEPNRCRDTTSLLNAAPASGSNVALFGHVGYPVACPVLDSLEPAEVAIYKPTLGAPARFIARVLAGQWAGLP